MLDFPFEKIEAAIGYTFKNKKLLCTAFTHSSYANENSVEGNERMEFFGDAILQFVTTEQLMKTYKNKDEGDLSKIRSAIVSTEGLTKVVDEMGIEDYVLMSKGAKKCNTRPKKLESNLYEAILCAIYLDGGLPVAKKFVLTTLSKQFKNAPTVVDFATELQEYCQANKLSFEYKLVGQAVTEIDTTYTYQLCVAGTVVATADGDTKKQAKHNCAKIALKKLNYKK